MNLKIKIRKILDEGLVLPVLKLKETHPEYTFTEKGYNMLLDNTTEEIIKLLGKE